MLTLFKDDKPYILILIPLFAIAIWTGQLLNPSLANYVFNAEAMPLYDIILRLTTGNNLIGNIVAIAILLINAYQIAQINARFKLIEKGTFLPSIIYILLASCVIDIRTLNPVTFANIFILLAIHRMFATYKSGKGLAPYFESSFLTATACLFYAPALYVIIFIWAVLFSLRSFRWREWMVSILGLLTPIYLYASYAYVFEDIRLFSGRVIANFHTQAKFLDHSIYVWIFICTTIFFLTVSIGFSFSGIIKKVNTRKYYNTLILFAILTVIAFFAIPTTNLEVLPLLAIPFTYFFTNMLLRMRPTVIAELIFIIYIGMIIALQFLHK